MGSEVWTEAEIEKGIAFRKEPSGRVLCWEICHGCHRSYTRGMGKLGYSTGHGLCFNCAGVDKLDSRKDLAEVLLELLDEGGLSKKAIMERTKASWRDVDGATKLLSGRGLIALKGSSWHKVRHEQRQLIPG